MQPEILWIYLCQWHPLQCCSIVIGNRVCVIIDLYLIEHIDGVDEHIGIQILVGNGKEVSDLGNRESCFFQNLPSHAVFDGLLHINEATGQVQRAFGRFLAAFGNKQFSAFITYKGCRSRTGVGIVGEAAGFALFTFEVVNTECLTAANRAEQELF